VVDGTAVTESREVGALDRSLTLSLLLLDGHLGGGEPVVCDVRIFEREDVSHLPFVWRAPSCRRGSDADDSRR
jgi:hypothetical protein